MSSKTKIFILIINFLIFYSLSASKIDYDNSKYGIFLKGNWETTKIKPEKILFHIIKNIKIDFKANNRFYAKADFILGIKKEWGGKYKVAEDRIFLLFDNGAREIIFYNKKTETKIATQQPKRISAEFVKTTEHY